MSSAQLRADQEKLRDLLGEQHESASLEYVARCDLRDRRDVVELAGEIAALGARGGYLVIGADDGGSPAGLMTEDQATLFDDATLRDKLSRYLPNDLEIHVGRHELGGDWFVIIGVAAHRDGVVVFCGDGTFEERERPRTAFRKGEIFVRHGSKTERPNQDDIRALRDADSNEQAWLRQVETVADIVVEIGKLVEEERPARPDGRITHIGQPTRIPTMRARLRTSLETLARLGGPELPSARELADSSSYVFLDQLLGAVYVASAEISSVLQGVVVSAASHA